jgi:putative PIN family toxin of toxin-antitoxin system
MVMRVVFDTNTVLSALVYRKGRLSWMREVWSQRWAIPLVSGVTEDEIRRVLQYPKFKLSSMEQEVLLNEYLPFCERVEIPDPPPAAPECRDPKDVSFLWLAMVSHADYLITGDSRSVGANGRFLGPNYYRTDVSVSFQ